MGKDYDRIFTILSVILTDNEKVTSNLLKGVTEEKMFKGKRTAAHKGVCSKHVLHRSITFFMITSFQSCEI